MAAPGGAAALDRFYATVRAGRAACASNRRPCRQPVALLVAARGQGGGGRAAAATSPASCAGCSGRSPGDRAASRRWRTSRDADAAGQPAHADGDHRLAGFIAAASRVPSFAWVRWDAQRRRAGDHARCADRRARRADFVKIDVEGMEHEVLAGLSRPVAGRVVRVRALGTGECAGSLDAPGGAGPLPLQRLARREPELEFRDWVGAEALGSWLRGRNPEGDSGDIYARLINHIGEA